MALARTRANIEISGLSSWKIREVGGDGYSPLSQIYLRDGKLAISAMSVNDSFGRNRAGFAWNLEASAKFPVVKTKANLIALLTSLSTLDIEHKILTRSGQYFNSGATSMPSPGNFGTRWRLVSDTDLDSDLYLEVIADCKLTDAQYDLLLASTSSNPADGSASTSAFTPLASCTAADIAAAGIASIEVGTSYADNIGIIRNGKFTAELITEKSSQGRSYGCGGVKVNVEAEAMQASASELARYDDVMLAANDWRVTFANGKIFAAAAPMGLTASFQHDKDSDGSSYIKVVGAGVMTPTAFVAAIT
jgi:hypothetical protein